MTRNKNPLYTFKLSPIISQLKIAIIVILFLFTSQTKIVAQTATANISRHQMLIGEQATLQLKVDNVTDEGQKILRWFNIPDTGNHIEVINRGKIDTVTTQEGKSTYMQEIVITSFDSGQWLIPVIAPIVKDIAGNTTTLNLEPTFINILPVDVSNLKEFHQIKNIIPVEYTDYTWLYIAIAALILIIAIYLLVRWLKKRKQGKHTISKISKGPPLEWALQEIDKLEQEKLIEKGEAKRFFTRLDEICRTYVDQRTQSHTLQSTTVEMIENLKQFLIREKDRVALLKYTKLSTNVKFAKYNPDVTQASEAILIAKETIINIEKQVTEQDKNAN